MVAVTSVIQATPTNFAVGPFAAIARSIGCSHSRATGKDGPVANGSPAAVSSIRRVLATLMKPLSAHRRASPGSAAAAVPLVAQSRPTAERVTPETRRLAGLVSQDITLFSAPPASSVSLAAQFMGKITNVADAAIRAETKLKVQDAVNTSIRSIAVLARGISSG